MINNDLEFIKICIRERNIFWTYHVNMRLAERFISREIIVNSVDSFEVIEAYPDDKYLPSYLIYAVQNEFIFHVLIAVDRVRDNVRVVTAYRPDIINWEADLKMRRRKP